MQTMASDDSSTGWDDTDARWREHAYVDYIADRQSERREFDLERVLHPKFAPDQPKEYAEFAGCSAHLDLSQLDLDENRTKQLLNG
jgi:hypothetical protein